MYYSVPDHDNLGSRLKIRWQQCRTGSSPAPGTR